MLYNVTCPHCRKALDIATGMTAGNIPEDEDLSICMKCGGVFIFDKSKDGGGRIPTPEEEKEIEGHAELAEAMRLFRLYKGAPLQ